MKRMILNTVYAVTALVIVMGCGRGGKPTAQNVAPVVAKKDVAMATVGTGELLQGILKNDGLDMSKNCFILTRKEDQKTISGLRIYSTPCKGMTFPAAKSLVATFGVEKGKSTTYSDAYTIVGNKPAGELEFVKGFANKFYILDLCNYGSSSPNPYYKNCKIVPNKDGSIASIKY